jgi:exosome complex RNA-binding protein Rrp4
LIKVLSHKKTVKMDDGDPVVPGDFIGKASKEMIPGSGTYLAGNCIYASVVGFVQIDGVHASVTRSKSGIQGSPVVPHLNCVVLAKVPIHSNVFFEQFWNVCDQIGVIGYHR